AVFTKIPKSRADATFPGCKPVDSIKRDEFMPKALALLFIAAINALRPPGYVRAKAAAAGFSDFIRANNKASARFMLSPARKVELELLQPAQEKSACCSVIFSDMFKRASEITTAVINLVIDEIGKAVLVLLLNSTSPVCASITNAARAFTEG